MSEAIALQAIERHIPSTPAQLAAARDLVGRFAANWHNPDADNLRGMMHADTRNIIPPMPEAADREGVVEHFRGVLRQLPDLRIEVVRWAPTGDTVMIEWSAKATVGGQPLTWTGVDRFCIRGDRMYEAHVYWDTRQLAERMAAAIAAAQAGAARAH